MVLFPIMAFAVVLAHAPPYVMTHGSVVLNIKVGVCELVLTGTGVTVVMLGAVLSMFVMVTVLLVIFHKLSDELKVKEPLLVKV